MMATNAVDIVEVGPRDGYQGIIPKATTAATSDGLRIIPD
jgi:hypothetical protein